MKSPFMNSNNTIELNKEKQDGFFYIKLIMSPSLRINIFQYFSTRFYSIWKISLNMSQIRTKLHDWPNDFFFVR